MQRTLDEVRRDGFEALRQHLGKAYMIRFLQQFEIGRGDYSRDWRRRVNRAQTQGELDALRRCVRRGQPYGTAAWCQHTVKRLGLEWTMRARGRPRKRDPKT